MNVAENLRYRDRVFIGGKWRHGRGKRLHTISPVTEQPNGWTATADMSDIDDAVYAARAALDDTTWCEVHPRERARYLETLHLLYNSSLDTMHDLIRLQNGSPVSFEAQVTHPAEILRLTAAYADDPYLFGREHTFHHYEVRREPAGVVALILPWNMPQKTLIMKLAPAILAGCAVIIKPAPETPLDALYLAELTQQAGFPPGIVSVLPVDRDPSILEYLVTHPGIDKIAFTGSTQTGARIARLCAADFRRVTLECGGKSAAIITKTADLDACVASLKDMSLANSGQICSNLTRLIVEAEVETEFTERLRAMMRKLTVGDPESHSTDIGPLVSDVQQKKVLDYIRMAREQGSRQVCGAGVPDREGWFVHPTLFTNVDPDAVIAQHEVFGPVLTTHPFQSEAHAVYLANYTRYGLAAAVYTGDLDQARRVAGRLKAGTVHINGCDTPLTAPLGGFKHSGIGRELGPESLAHFQEIKVIAG